MENLPFKEILLLILTALSSYLIWRVQFQKDKIKNIENQLAERKYKMYSELIYLLFDISNSEKIGKKISDKELLTRLLSAKKEMFIYAPDKIFKKFTEWLLQLNNQGSVDHFKTYFELMKMMRKDMGHLNTKIDLDDFMLFYMQNREEYKKFKETNNWE
ncbi:MAG: hypothetical protein C4K58_07095 [Flavobacteriaceae bacterium]|nr:MAG: hypothetical protein C4K58_07095 [Flavobacteriaceae bacterium]